MGTVIPFPAPEDPPHPAPEPQRWTREQLAADRAAHAFTPGRTPRGPEALTRGQLAADRRSRANSWRLRKAIFAPRTPSDEHHRKNT